MKIHLKHNFNDVPFVEIDNENYLKLLASTYLFTLDKYLKSWRTQKREIGMIVDILYSSGDILNVEPIVRLKAQEV